MYASFRGGGPREVRSSCPGVLGGLVLLSRLLAPPAKRGEKTEGGNKSLGYGLLFVARGGGWRAEDVGLEGPKEEFRKRLE